jgi:hypothetical protein
MRSQLQRMFEVAKVIYIPDHVLGVENGRRQQGISQIQGGVQFADKAQAPILQVADACAFSFRRFFANQEYGSELIAAMGLKLDKDEWSGPMSSSPAYSPDRP